MKKLFLLLYLGFTATVIQSQNLYFPPLSGTSLWDTISLKSLGWCTDKADTLYKFLQQENTKAFIVLKDGKMALEKYFGTFTKDSLWYWASAGKTLTSFLIGKAQEEGYLSITDSSSKYLGKGWTACTDEQEGKIKILNQLTMTSGLDDGVNDNHCTLDTCLNYLADPGTRWAYHNAPYTLLEKVLTTSTGKVINTYTQSKLKSPTGMNGFWLTVDYDNVYFSTPRSMARFGLLIQNNGIWNTDTLMYDTAYFYQMINTSQKLNKSYGYLWWLNGKEDYMLPGTQLIFPGPYATDAPKDMIAALGKNGQILSISSSKGLVVVRMGDNPNSPVSEITTLFCNQIWQLLNEVMCEQTSIQPNSSNTDQVMIYPNPARHSFTIDYSGQYFSISIYDMSGREILKKEDLYDKAEIDNPGLVNGVYMIRLKSGSTRPYINKLLIFQQND
jgi:CubicO group peptidase (beta-lactamase class C family)